MPKFMNRALQLVARLAQPSSHSAVMASDSDLSDATSTRALEIAADVRAHQKRKERNTEMTRQVIEKYRSNASAPGQPTVSSKEEIGKPTLPVQDIARIVQFPTADQDEAITTMIAALERRVNRRHEELKEENLRLQGKNAELTGVVADLATKNSELERTLAGLRAELADATQALDLTQAARDKAMAELSRLEICVSNEQAAFEQKLANAAADARTEVDTIKEQLRRRTRRGRWFALGVAISAVVAAIVAVLN